MRKLWLAAVVAVLAGLAAPAQAGDALRKLSSKLEKGLKADPPRKVAVLGFPYTDGAASKGSGIIQERLTTYLAEGGAVQVVERQLLQKILDEKKLAQTGLLDAETSKELGKVLGVTALVTGTLNDVGRGKTEINARAIEADTGRILSAGQATVETTWGPAQPPVAVVDPRPATGKNVAQLAILLDTSNSMDGLISQAKTQLWRIVNEIAGAKKDGAVPTVQVALYQYGNSSLNIRQNWIQQVVPFTTDLDRISEALFSLRTNGGEEFAATAIQDALRDLAWSSDPNTYKAIFIAGNEPFTQGPVPFRESIAAAVRRGVVVNTVYCGDRNQGVNEQWLAGAQTGGGEYLVINQDSAVASINAPQDVEISRLSYELNDTFIPMGESGRMRKENQTRQDSNALSAAGGASMERAAFKAAPQYRAAASEWDAVSAVMEGSAPASAAVAKADLPAEVKAKDEKAQIAYVQEKAGKRRELEAKIQKLQQARGEFIKAKEKEGSANTLGQAMVEAVRKQASKKGYTFKK